MFKKIEDVSKGLFITPGCFQVCEKQESKNQNSKHEN